MFTLSGRGFDPATFQLLAQHSNHYATCCREGKVQYPQSKCVCPTFLLFFCLMGTVCEFVLHSNCIQRLDVAVFSCFECCIVVTLKHFSCNIFGWTFFSVSLFGVVMAVGSCSQNTVEHSQRSVTSLTAFYLGFYLEFYCRFHTPLFLKQNIIEPGRFVTRQNRYSTKSVVTAFCLCRINSST
jgi:hypothetical protein